MRLGAISLLAVIPFAVPETTTSPPCAIAIEMHVRAPIAGSTVEWRAMFGEVERIWAPYGVTFCWATAGDPCAGLEVRLRVLVADQAVPRHGNGANVDALAWIGLNGGRPGREIVLSAGRARVMVGQSTVGCRRVAAWPVQMMDDIVPIVLGRALAHEIGHFVLGSTAHTRAGLMAARFYPQQVTFGPRSGFRLSGRAGAAVRRQCGK